MSLLIVDNCLPLVFDICLLCISHVFDLANYYFALLKVSLRSFSLFGCAVVSALRGEALGRSWSLAPLVWFKADPWFQPRARGFCRALVASAAHPWLRPRARGFAPQGPLGPQGRWPWVSVERPSLAPFRSGFNDSGASALFSFSVVAAPYWVPPPPLPLGSVWAPLGLPVPP